MEDIVKQCWPEWETAGVIGEGASGTVYEAVRKKDAIETRAAVKVISIPSNRSEIDSLRSEGMNDEAVTGYYRTLVEDFRNEITIMESFKALPNIVSIEDYRILQKQNEIGFDVCIRMELLTPFYQAFRDRTPDAAEIQKIGIDICSALEYCAKKDIIHRDIKPENIFVNEFGDYKLGDFGVARILSSNLSMTSTGTFSYMAPEVFRGAHYNATTDLYSLGLVLYTLANHSRLPFLNTGKQLLTPAERSDAVERRISGELLPPPRGVSADFARVILKACDPDPAYRYASAAEMKEALQRVVPTAAAADPPATDAVEAVFAPAAHTADTTETAKNSENGEKAKTKKKKSFPFRQVLFLVIALLIFLALITRSYYYTNLVNDMREDLETVMEKQEAAEDESEAAEAEAAAAAQENTDALPVTVAETPEPKAAEPEAMQNNEPESKPEQNAAEEAVVSTVVLEEPVVEPEPAAETKSEPAAETEKHYCTGSHDIKYSEHLDADGKFKGMFEVTCTKCDLYYEQALIASSRSVLYYTHIDGWGCSGSYDDEHLPGGPFGNLKFYDADKGTYWIVKHDDPNLTMVFQDLNHKTVTEPNFEYSYTAKNGMEAYSTLDYGYVIFHYAYNGNDYTFSFYIHPD